jgi:hypothetical protein
MAAKIPKMNVSKIDAAKRQLETAITLYFSNADPVSVHALAAAAHEILHALCKSRGGKSLIKDIGIRKGKEKEYRKIINEAQNFFKHGDSDPDASFEFRPTTTETFIFDACQMYISVTTETPKPLYIFNFWFVVNHPFLMTEAAREQLTSEVVQTFNIHDRTTFYTEASNAYDVGTAKRLRNPET